MTAVERFMAKVEKADNGCWLWTAAVTADGYGTIGWQGRVWRAHRVAWTLAHGPIPDGACVLHRCDTPACVNPQHLWLGSQRDNARDREAKGRRAPPQGELNGRSKLTAAQVAAIRERAANGEQQRPLAAEYGISQATVSAIVRREAWTHTT